MTKNILITICGRAGSKGFQNKNLKTFCGLPMVYYSLAAARLFAKARPKCRVDICLNTDSADLAQLVAEKYPQVTYLPRSAALAGDAVPKEAVYQDCLLRMEAANHRRYDCVIDLDITSPLRQEHDLVRAMELYESTQPTDLVMSAAPSRRNPYFNMARVDGEGCACRIIDNAFTARQQAPVCYDINASLYIFKRAFLLGEGAKDLWRGRVRIYEMFDTGILDIDSEADYQLMEVIGKHLYETVDGFKRVREEITKE